MEKMKFEDYENKTLAELMCDVTDIHRKLFPQATLSSQILKFYEEFKELQEEIDHDKGEEALKEFADMFIVMCGIRRFDDDFALFLSLGMQKYINSDMDKSDFSSMLCEEVVNKMNKNIDRVWDSKDGYYKHVSTIN